MPAVVMTRFTEDSYTEEILNGKIHLMAKPSIIHADTTTSLTVMFHTFLKGRKCRMFTEVDVFLGEKDRVVPDLIVVCDPEKIKPNAIYGAPDLAIEVLSKSTAKNDKGYKKELYAKHGVKEYWIVDTNNKMIEIYTLQDSQLKLQDTHAILQDYEIDHDHPEKTAHIKSEFSPYIFPDMTVKLSEVFENIP